MMNPRLYATLFLAITVVILAWYLLNSDKSLPESAVSRFAAIDPDSIHQIHISRTGKENVLIEKISGTWTMLHPVQIAANPFRINSILSLPYVTALRLGNIEDIDNNQLGLAPASVTLALDDHLFVFGHTDPLGDGRYVSYNNSVYIIDDELYHQLQQDAGFFASTRLLSEGIELIRIVYPGIEFTYRDGAWEQSGGDLQLSADEMDKLAIVWSQLEASRISFTEGDPVPASIVLHAASGEQISLAAAASPAGLILSRLDTGLDYWFSPDTSLQLGISLTEGE